MRVEGDGERSVNTISDRFPDAATATAACAPQTIFCHKKRVPSRHLSSFGHKKTLYSGLYTVLERKQPSTRIGGLEITRNHNAELCLPSRLVLVF